MSVSRTLLYSFSYSLLLITTAVVESAEISSSIAAGTVRVLRDNDISSNNTESSSHGFGNSTGDNFNNNNMNNNSSPSTHGNSFEFIAFLVWYLILVGCCIIPTCCAYRRRRLAEQRYLMHQANLQRMRQNGLFVLSNFQHAHPDGMGGSYLVRRYNNGNNHHNSERIQQDRLRALTDTLKGTTMVRLPFFLAVN